MSGVSAADRAAKRRRVLDVLSGRGAGSLALTSHAAVAWYLDGVASNVSLFGDPVASVVVRPDGDEIRVFANEADRFAAEQLGAEDHALVTRVDWDGVLAPAGVAELTEADVAEELRAARARLLPAERERYAVLCREAAEVLTDVALAAEPSWTERRAAAAIASGLVERGIDALVILVAGDERLPYRHPVPHDGALGRRAMLVLCGRRSGLIANVTRWVDLGSGRGGDAVLDAERRILEVERAFLDATVPGATIGEAFSAGVAAYAANGFAPDEWRNHHQGGPAGYVGRDPRGGPTVSDVVQEGQAFAWNPSAPGVKVEDTLVRDADGFTVLTRDARWPTVTVGGRERPGILFR